MLSPDYSKRDYLLPPGCKDLIDVINLEKTRTATPCVFLPRKPYKLQLGELPGIPAPLTGEIEIGNSTTVAVLAKLVGQTPEAIIADLMTLGVFATLNQVLGLEAIRRIARKYGYAVKG